MGEPGEPTNIDVIHAQLETERRQAEARLPQFLGLTEQQAVHLAAELGMTVRFIRHDQEVLHLDLRPGRLTLDVRTGTVTSGKAG